MQPATETIRKTAGVCGGNACIRDTRIPVWTLQRLRELGRTDAQLLNDYPTLMSEDLAAAWEYTKAHASEIQDVISRQGPSRQTA